MLRSFKFIEKGVLFQFLKFQIRTEAYRRRYLQDTLLIRLIHPIQWMERWRWTKTAFDFRILTQLVYTFQTVTPNYVQCSRCNGKCELWRTHAFNLK